MRTELGRQATIAAIAGLIFFTSLGGPSLWDIDEPRNAGCAREMLDRGDWIVPTFNGELRVHKPVLLYWFMMTAYDVWGVNEFAARFWSAAFAVGTVLITYHGTKKVCGPSAAFWAALVLATSLNYVVIARAATPDSLYIFFSTAAIVFFWTGLATQPGKDGADDRPPTSALRWTGIYAAMGLAVLAKGPIGALLNGAVMVLFLLWWQQPWPMIEQPACGWLSRLKPMFTFAARLAAPRHVAKVIWSMRPLLGVGVLAAVILPWYVAVGMRTGGRWIGEFLLTHNVQRFLTPMENHRGPFFYYAIAIAIGLFPWSLFLAPTIGNLRRNLRRSDAWDPRYLLPVCWIGVYFVFFSLATTKLPNYILPAYPPLAILTGCGLAELLAARSERSIYWLRAASWLLTVCGILIAAALPIVAYLYLPGEYAIALLGVIPAIGGAVCLWLLKSRGAQAALRSFAATAVLFMLAGFGVAQLCVDRHQHTARLIDDIRNSSGGQTHIAGFRFFRPSWVFYAGHEVDHLQDARGALDFLCSPGAVLITTDAGMRELEPLLPASVTELDRRQKFLARGQIVVLGNRQVGELARVSRSTRRPEH